jgi:hypothetical protein
MTAKIGPAAWIPSTENASRPSALDMLSR